MSYPEFEKDLYEIYVAEVTGEALFSTAASLSFSSVKKQKWRTLAALETQTKNRYLDFVQSRGEKAKYPVGAKIAGHLFGLLFGLLPWATAMKMLKSGTPSLIEVFGRLDKNANPDDSAFFSYVLAHEMAIEKFAELELSNDPCSLDSVNQLLA